MYNKFSINLDLYERLTAVRRALGLPTSDYLERAKQCLERRIDFVVKGRMVEIKREN